MGVIQAASSLCIPCGREQGNISLEVTLTTLAKTRHMTTPKFVGEEVGN